MKSLTIYRLLFIVLFLVFAGLSLDAQCPMCKIAAESNLNNGGSSAKGLNAGIFYLLLVPYSLVGAVALYWYKNRKKD